MNKARLLSVLYKIMMNPSFLSVFFLCISSSLAFAPTNSCICRSISQLHADATSQDVVIDPKEAVKLFGRLAEKYIMLDASGGMCCYSACTGKSFAERYHMYLIFL